MPYALASSPLRIDHVTSSLWPGTIGMTLCPGRKGPSMAVGVWNRDLAADLEVVREWGIDIGIALVEDYEFALLEVPQFKAAVAAAGLPWVYLPIPDGGIPHAAWLERWQTAGPRVRNVLRAGGHVLVHCRAGLGRTGLVAAMLMIELGASPEEAIEAVRAARDGTIETQAQEEFVRFHTAKRRTPVPSRASRMAGTMFGAAIGDALGSAFEFLSSTSIEEALGEPFAWEYLAPLPGSLLAARAPGTPTDDTAMALSVAGVIAANPEPSPADFATAFLADLDRKAGRFGTMFWTGGPGGATVGALSRLARGADPATCGLPDAGGNGAAMRSHPIGFLADRSEALRVAGAGALVTHGHPAAVEAARAVAALVHDAIAGFEPMLEPPAGITEPEFLGAWHEAHRALPRGADELPAHLKDAAMSGWCTVATAHAISYVFQHDPRRAIAAAAASGGDTDTVASIVGAIVGARHGIEALEGDWTSELTARDAVLDAIESLSRR